MLRHFLTLVCLYLVFGLTAQEIWVQVEHEGAYFFEGEDTILYYQAAEKSQDHKFTRSNYIHPLYTLDGQLLTEDFPEDHPHHRGIFWAWHQLFIGQLRVGDGWALEHFTSEVKSIRLLRSSLQSKSIETTVHWKSPQWTSEDGFQKPFVEEHCQITVHPAEAKYRCIDIEISMIALEANVRIGGSEDAKGYGGFSPRIRLPDDLVFSGPHGLVQPDNLPVEAGAWLDISGAFGKGGVRAGLTILCHPHNPGHPHPWILRAKGSMQNAVYPHPGAHPVSLSNEIPTVLRFRLLVHNDKLEIDDIPAIYIAYKDGSSAIIKH